MGSYRQDRVTFPGTFGARLAARLERPPYEPRAYALFAHCFTCSKDLKAVKWISRSLVERGLGVLRFDFTGLGESEGDFADTNFTSNVEDLVAAADYMRLEHCAPRILIGHSLGGAAVLAAASRIPESVAVTTIGAPSDTTHLSEMLVGLAPELEGSGESEVKLGSRSFRVKKQFVDDLREKSLIQSTAHLGRALLIMHSPVDEIVGIEHAQRIYGWAKHPKSFVSLDNADHLLNKQEQDAQYVGEVLAAWAGRYLGSKPRKKAVSEATNRPGEVVVEGGPSSLAQKIVAGPHRLWADEPRRLGGSETGPTPYDLLLASLGACTSMTLRLYADRKGWPLQDVRVRLMHDRIHSQDCEDCETREGRVDRIEREISITGDLDEAQRARLMEIADHCPVHRTLAGEIVIRTKSTS